MKLIITLFAGLLLTGCATVGPTKVIPLKGRYLEGPMIETTNKPFDEVWNNLIDVLATEGFPIKLLDKENGLVVSERTSLRSDYTFEDKEGKLENYNAYLVFPTISNGGFTRVYPSGITGVANIRIRDMGNGKTKINPNLTSIQTTETGVFKGEDEELLRGMRSTGVFELNIINQVT